MPPGVTELEKAYALVQDLDILGVKPKYQNRFQAQMSTPKNGYNGKDTKVKAIEKEFTKVSPTTKYYKCQGYRHIVANCSNPIKITFVNGVPVAESESDSNKLIYQGKEEDFDFDEHITGDDVGLNCIRPTLSTYLSINN